MLKKLPLVVIAALLIFVAFQEAGKPLLAMSATPSATQNPAEPVPDSELQYRVAFVAPDDTLNVRVASGVQAAIVDKLQNGEIVIPINAGQENHGDLWVPIRYQDVKTGWVNRSYLIATLDRATFCADDRPKMLIAALQDAVEHLDGQKLAQLVAPRGLYIALDGEKTLLLSPAEVLGFFQDHSTRSWGRNGNTDQVVSGTLADKVTPLLQKNLVPKDVSVELGCNDNQDSLSDRVSLNGIQIPGDEIENFYSVLRPGLPGNDLDWGAWGLAIEYWRGEPVLTGLVYYYWTP